MFHKSQVSEFCNLQLNDKRLLCLNAMYLHWECEVDNVSGDELLVSKLLLVFLCVKLCRFFCCLKVGQG